MKKLFILLALTLMLNACGLKSSKLGFALVSDVVEPDESSYFKTNNGRFTKKGKACGKNVLGLIATGDLSVEAAKRNGRISNVVSVDTTIKNMIFTTEVCTVVNGN